ncbi:MATE family efflux transporter [Sporomusa sphaeroides]|uniref:Probable multidrug resistance protein NorM n=1 Tax=Sporomusa sphaeroides DSM 2875 TaxID=1337886 RepID=A0ABM9W861_9FIRM|nr:MATE family efflux transporter [Sporomusa sphaeroides]OLS54875.1 multidrug resistance protein NorM [Sporomusa sphaeroides DSM 2875]CVK21104.1 Multidrug resistance protein NorM [Sporomusa sphaeroides DSM 2875]
MNQTRSLRDKTRQFLFIFFPIFIAQLSLTATGFFDTIMAGQVSPYDLAGVAIGTNLWLPVFTGISGVLGGLTPILAQLHGAGRKAAMPFYVIQGLYLALILGLVVIGAGSAVLLPLLNTMDLEGAVHRIAFHFLCALAIGIVPLFAAAVLRNFIDSLGYTRVTMLITLCAVPINIALNYLLIFGKFGFPQLGGVGAGYGSALTYWCLLIISIGVVRYVEPFKGYRIFAAFPGISFTAWRELLVVGLPIGLSIFCEVAIFSVVALLMSEYGTAVIAAHQAAINFAGVIYMVPLSIGITLTIVVGYEAGARRYHDARQYSYLGIGIAVFVGIIFAAGLFAFNNQIARLYTEDPAVLELVRNFLVYAIFFQLSDAIAAPIQGALRGYKDVKITLLMAIISYWFIGMPVGYFLANYSPLQAYGYWVGFIVGLAVGAVVLLLRLIRLQKKYTKLAEKE